MKLLTIAVPCYNSQDYMEKCVSSLVVGGDEVEVLIVDDGSSDRTGEIADELQKQYPGIVRAIHQPNKGHGGAVNTGIANASGMYFKVVDSDDKVKASAYKSILEKLREYRDAQEKIDLLISNFIYDKEGQSRKKVMHYRNTLPVNRMFSWEESGHFKKGEYILMHSVIYRTALLKACGIRLPEHCFYVDNIYVFNPMPAIKNLYYLDVNFYYYFIGRNDQSVNQDVMIRRLDQQARVNRIMFDYFSDGVREGQIVKNSRLYKYMYNYLEIITTITSVLAIISDDPDKIAIKEELWNYLSERDYDLYKKLKNGILGIAVHLPGKFGKMVVSVGYNVARNIFGFN